MIPSFIDSLKREWFFELDMLTVERVFKSTGYNLTKLVAPGGTKPLEDDPGLHLNVLFELLRPQADVVKPEAVDAESFKAGLKDLEVMEACGQALQEAVINFSPSRLRSPMRELKTKNEAFRAAVLKQSIERIQKMDPEAEALKEMATLTAGSNSPGNAPASSASIPSPLPSDSLP